MTDFLKDVLILLRPRFLSFKNPLVSANSKKDFYRNLVLGTAGFFFLDRHLSDFVQNSQILPENRRAGRYSDS